MEIDVYWRTRTIAEAQAQGYTHLRATCPDCGRIADVPWPLLLRLQLMLFPMSPEVLHGIELGRIGRQEFQLDVAALGFDPVADQTAAMGLQPVPDEFPPDCADKKIRAARHRWAQPSN
jgi:hypothetical protein